jgi:hypothetical protein
MPSIQSCCAVAGAACTPAPAAAFKAAVRPRRATWVPLRLLLGRRRRCRCRCCRGRRELARQCLLPRLEEGRRRPAAAGRHQCRAAQAGAGTQPPPQAAPQGARRAAKHQATKHQASGRPAAAQAQRTCCLASAAPPGRRTSVARVGHGPDAAAAAAAATDSSPCGCVRLPREQGGAKGRVTRAAAIPQRHHAPGAEGKACWSGGRQPGRRAGQPGTRMQGAGSVQRGRGACQRGRAGPWGAWVSGVGRGPALRVGVGLGAGGGRRKGTCAAAGQARRPRRQSARGQAAGARRRAAAARAGRARGAGEGGRRGRWLGGAGAGIGEANRLEKCPGQIQASPQGSKTLANTETRGGGVWTQRGASNGQKPNQKRCGGDGGHQGGGGRHFGGRRAASLLRPHAISGGFSHWLTPVCVL